MRLARMALLPLVLAAGAGSELNGSAHVSGPYLLPCTGVALRASYLADVEGKGPGFLFRIENRTQREIQLEQPVPSSAHWYALVGNRWMWRASAGSGGALVDAERKNGPMFAFQPSRAPSEPGFLSIRPHGSKEWTEPMRDNPAIEYRPSCGTCNYPGEKEYQAVFAYAYLPNPEEHATDLLRCGLRSEPVPMPPIALRGGHAAGGR